MNKILICIVFLFLSSNLWGQSIATKDNHSTTLFEYGKPPQSSEDNFTNLFQNFPKFVTNADKDIALISYEYVTEIRSQKQIKRYLKKNIKVNVVNGQTTMRMDSTQVEKSFIKISFPPEHQIDKKDNKASLKEKLDALVGDIHLGDKVYVLYFTAGGTHYKFYMFVNPRKSVLLKDGNFLGFDIPLYYADFYSKNKAGNN